MNWNKIDLKSEYEKDQTILDGYTTNNLLLELNCNFKDEDLTEGKVRQHLKQVIASKLNCFNEIIDSNIKQIIEQAKKEK